MGYYDEPEFYDITVSFECAECGHENEDVETAVSGRFSTEAPADCTECGYENTVNIEDTTCHCGERCVC